MPDDAAAELAPTGTLRAAINLSNALLTAMDAGKPRGIVVDLAMELGRRLGVPVQIVPYPSPGVLADAVSAGAWDVGFIAAEPQRAKEIAFTAAYLEIEATYLVPPGSPIREVAEVDREGARVAVLARTAYELYLSRNLQHATLVRENSFDATFHRFVADRLDALAGVRAQIMDDAEKLPGSHVLDRGFTSVQQAIGTPKGRTAGARYLARFVEDVKASGLVARSIAKNGVRGVSVARASAFGA